MIPISNILTPREEVIKGRFQGVLQAHKVSDEDDRLESSPEQLLSVTYPSNKLETVFNYVDNKLNGQDSQGGILLAGPYGSGKSHGLLVLYHMLRSPGVAQSWLNEWDISIDLPEESDAVMVSTSEVDAELIWEPVFRGAGKEEVLEDIERYPTTNHIEQLTEEGTFGVFFDEIESWWESFSKQKHDEDILERNRFFLQNLLEVANDPKENLFTIITLLDRSKSLKEILNRTDPYVSNLNDTGDRERIIKHRLFEGNPDDINESEVRAVVKKYVDSYDYPIEIDEPKRYEDRMVESYPFHPEMIELLDRIFGAAKERQSVRGAMSVLAETVRDAYNETDLITTSDIEPRAFRGINPTLFDRYVSDKEKLEDTEHATELLQVILLYTLDEQKQEATTTECLLGTFKPSKTTVDKLHIALEGLYGKAHYLDRQDDSYFITEDPKLTALVAREQDRILESDLEGAKEELVDVVKEDLFDSKVYVYEYDDIPDNNSLTFIVTVENKANGSLKSEMSDFFEDIRYSNTVQFITPKRPVVEDEDIISKAARILGGENLRGKVEDEKGELESIIRDDRRELRNELYERYGKWVKWSGTDNGLRMRRIPVEPDVNDVTDEIGRDKKYIGEKILEEVEKSDGGIRVESLLNDFLQFRKMPVLLDTEIFYSTVRSLQEDGDIVLEGDKANFYVGELGDYPSEISGNMTIRYPDNLPESVFQEEKENSDIIQKSGSDQNTIEEISKDTTEKGNESQGEIIEQEGNKGKTSETETETAEVALEGNSSRVLLSRAETRINENTDTVTSVKLSYDLDDLSKGEIMEFLENLPDGNKIEANVVVERDSE